MNDKKFDEMIKSKIQKNEKMDQRFEELFDTYKEKYKMERGSKMNTNKVSFIQKMRYVAAVLIVGIVLGTGGMTYAHINGVESFISPVLRKLGIESKYEENATQINKSITVNTETVEMLNAAVDESTLIVGYKIHMPKVRLEHWIEVLGSYSVNDISVKPVNTSIEKDEKGEGTEYIYYQIFDLNEIKFYDADSINFKANIFEINEYVEVEDLESATINYLNKYEGSWNFENNISVKNIEENEVYKLTSNKVNYKNIIFDVEEVVTSSFTSMIRIKTDKTKYNGDAFEVFYNIYNESGKEIAAGKEEREYDERIYNDRLFIAGIDSETKLTIEIYFKDINENKYEKIATVKVDMSKAEKILDDKVEYAVYEGDKYTFEYNKEWSIEGILDEEDVGPLSRFKGSLSLNMESTTNAEYGMSVHVIMKESNDVDLYVEDLRVGLENEYFEYVSKEQCKVGKLQWVKLVMKNAEMINVTYVTEVNGMVYELTFNGDEKEYNNRKEEIQNMVESFDAKN